MQKPCVGQAIQGLEREPRVCETGFVRRILQVEKRDPPLLASCEATGERRLAHLPCTHKPNYGKLTQKPAEMAVMAGTRDHGSNPYVKNKKSTFDFHI